MKINSKIWLAPFLILTALVASAQRPHQPPDPAQMIQHRVDFLTNKLGLSPSQQQQASTIFTNEMTSVKSLHDQMNIAHQNLEGAVRSNNINGIEQAAQMLGSLTSQSISIHGKAEATFYQTLNAEQQSKYSQIHEHGPGMHAGFGRGGPGAAHPF
jgi:hypothetical protein